MKRKLAINVQIVNDGAHKESAIFVIDENQNAIDKMVFVNEDQINILTERIERLRKTCVLKSEFSKEVRETILKEGSSKMKEIGEDYAPVEHSSSEKKYGIATAAKYGHMKFINTMDEYNANKDSKEHAISVNLLEALLEKYKKGEIQ